jgi:prefoldin subunit 5
MAMTYLLDTVLENSTYICCGRKGFVFPGFSYCLFSEKAMTRDFTMIANADHLTAALAAAAELARSGTYLYSPEAKKGIVFPVSIPQSPESEVSSNTSDEEDKDCEEDAERRIARSRERNREHARRTRLRKKAQLESLQSKVKGLQADSKVLKQSLEECSIASILVGLASGETHTMTQSLVNEATVDGEQDLRIVGGKRKRFVSDVSDRIPQALKINIDGQNTLIGGGRTHINWKTGIYSDENGNKRQLNHDHLESLRYVSSTMLSYNRISDTDTRFSTLFPFSRERNRMHAKMTRDRKKSFISTIETTIEKLETDNKRMKEALEEVIQTHFKSSACVPGVTPVSSPQAHSRPTPQHDISQLDLSPPTKRARVAM